MITGSGNNSRDLTQRTEGRTITKVMGGVGKKQGKVAEKINCATLRITMAFNLQKTNVLLTAILACLIRLQLSKHILCFESLEMQE